MVIGLTFIGEFGVVYKAHLLQSKNGNDYTIVAVKTLKGIITCIMHLMNNIALITHVNVLHTHASVSMSMHACTNL